MQIGNIQKMISDAFNTSIPSIGPNLAMHVIADFPNQSFVNAIDVDIIKGYTMTMNPRKYSESEDILDEEEFIMLSTEVISNLIDEEPDICTIDDVKVRFR